MFCTFKSLNLSHKKFVITSLHGTSTGEDIFKKAEKNVLQYNLQWNFTTDGGKNMCGTQKGLVGILKIFVKNRNVQNIWTFIILFTNRLFVVKTSICHILLNQFCRGLTSFALMNSAIVSLVLFLLEIET